MSIKKKLFMAKRLYHDLNVKQPPVFIPIKGEPLTYYYLNFVLDKKRLNKSISEFDSDGIPMNKSYIDVSDSKNFYYPISIGQYALAMHNSFLDTGDVFLKESFLRLANWFVRNKTSDADLGDYWLTEMPKPEFNLDKPWKSAFSQSRAISVCLRAFQLTKDSLFYETALNALVPFSLNTNEGGVRVGFENTTFYEEYVALQPTRILDGGFFSLFGLHDLMIVTKNEKDFIPLEKATILFNDGIKGLKYWLPKFDMGYWVYYNRCEIDGYPQNDPCTIGYLKLITKQLEIITALTGDPFFGGYQKKFSSYLKPNNIVKMYYEKYKALKMLNRL